MNNINYYILTCLLLLLNACTSKTRNCCGTYSCPDYAIDHFSFAEKCKKGNLQETSQSEKEIEEIELEAE